MKGLCNSCYSTNIEIEFDEFRKPICISCKKELAAIKRKEVN